MSTDKTDGAKPAKPADKGERVLKAKADQQAAAPGPKKRDWKVIMIGVLVFVGLVGSLAAWLQGKASRQPEVDGLTAERDECRDEKAGCESTVTELEGQIQLLEARRQVARAADELGEQNFGSANEALHEAAEGLRAQGQGGAADRLEQIAITPTDDPTEQQAAIRAVGRDIDRTIGR
ncbi:MAG: hypothetical protein JJ863_08950 [Deltaproteobacteria bacterium]|nr:hypothetical protein [Deltaproteobacteria bacterium]